MVAMHLKDQIERRKQEAWDKRIYYKAYLVARYLGDCSSFNRGSFTTESTVKECKFQNDDFTIDSTTVSYNWVEGWSSFRLKIFYKGKMVFYEISGPGLGFGEVKTYIPARWGAALNRLYKEAQEAEIKFKEEEKQKRKEFFAERETSERANWGLEPFAA